MLTKLKNQKEEMLNKPRNLGDADCCYGLNCYETNVWSIEVIAGTFGKIQLNLCEKCTQKFNVKEEEKEKKKFVQINSGVNNIGTSLN